MIACIVGRRQCQNRSRRSASERVRARTALRARDAVLHGQVLRRDAHGGLAVPARRVGAPAQHPPCASRVCPRVAAQRRLQRAQTTARRQVRTRARRKVQQKHMHMCAYPRTHTVTQTCTNTAHTNTVEEPRKRTRTPTHAHAHTHHMHTHAPRAPTHVSVSADQSVSTSSMFVPSVCPNRILFPYVASGACAPARIRRRQTIQGRSHKRHAAAHAATQSATHTRTYATHTRRTHAHRTHTRTLARTQGCKLARRQM